MAAGTSEQIVQEKRSHIGAFLKPVLPRAKGVAAARDAESEAGVEAAE